MYINTLNIFILDCPEVEESSANSAIYGAAPFPPFPPRIRQTRESQSPIEAWNSGISKTGPGNYRRKSAECDSRDPRRYDRHSQGPFQTPSIATCLESNIIPCMNLLSNRNDIRLNKEQTPIVWNCPICIAATLWIGPAVPPSQHALSKQTTLFYLIFTFCENQTNRPNTVNFRGRTRVQSPSAPISVASPTR